MSPLSLTKFVKEGMHTDEEQEKTQPKLDGSMRKQRL